jgi:hypothetical protein
VPRRPGAGPRMVTASQLAGLARDSDMAGLPARAQPTSAPAWAVKASLSWRRSFASCSPVLKAARPAAAATSTIGYVAERVAEHSRAPGTASVPAGNDSCA